MIPQRRHGDIHGSKGIRNAIIKRRMGAVGLPASNVLRHRNRHDIADAQHAGTGAVGATADLVRSHAGPL